jgi:hypothetical protein
MKTIQDVIEEGIVLMKKNEVLSHIAGSKLIAMELSMIKGFDPMPVHLFSLYPAYLVNKHHYWFKYGIKKKIQAWWKSRTQKFILQELLNDCEAKKFGDGDRFLQEAFQLIRQTI